MLKKEERPYPIEFKNMFREYDIRGLCNEKELNDENVYRIVKAYSIYLQKRKISRAVVGYDNRECSPYFAEAAIKALRESGIDVIFVGLSLTPVVYFAQYHYGCEGAVMITASHNPNGWSGFKLAKGYSKTLETDDIIEVYNYLDKKVSKPKKIGSFSIENVRDAYIDNIVSRIKMGKKKIRVVTESANGGAGLFINEILQRLGCMTFQLNSEPNVDYPKYFPNPSDIDSRETMIRMVKHFYVKADLGVYLDGDGDRIGVVDENGQNIWSDVLLAVLAKQLLQKKKGAKVIYDVKCTKALDEVVKACGGNPIMCKTGHSYIKAKMHELSAELAGERSGHIFIGGDDYYGFDDACFVTAKLVEFLSHSKESLSQIISAFPKYVTSTEIHTHCADEVKYEVVDKLIKEFKQLYPGKVCDINGARVEFEDGWGLVRASSNLPCLVLIFEAKTARQMQNIKDIFKSVLNKYPQICKEWENDC